MDAKLKPFEVLAGAIRSEIEAANFYSKLLDRVKNILLQQKLKFLVLEEKKHKKILEYLSRVERSHYFLIKAEIDLLSRFPDYYDVKDFHLGHDLVHVGP